MTSQQVITSVYEYAGEYIEMVDNPTALVVGLLANKIVELDEYIQYLEKRLEHENYN